MGKVGGCDLLMDLFPSPMAKHTSNTPLLFHFRRVKAWLSVLSDLL